MFHIILTIACAVFVIGYLFFAAAAEHEPAEGPSAPNIFGSDQDAA